MSPQGNPSERPANREIAQGGGIDEVDAPGVWKKGLGP
jgi:hypothetical protein